MNNRQIYQEFKNLGRDLFLNGDAAARNGNISLLLSNGRLAITRSGSLLSDLLPSDIILVRLEKNKTS
ncbi:MAG: class II aldolase/adducin family protein, partial [Chloroflexi bacterium]|nr:class II aldolase/adducin family protein [Chloroflexota bacterium]